MGVTSKEAATIMNSERMPCRSEVLLRLSALIAADSSVVEMGERLQSSDTRKVRQMNVKKVGISRIIF